MAQVLANFLSNTLASIGDSDATGWPYVAFDPDPKVVKAARKLIFPILYGDGSRPTVLQSAGIQSSKAIMVMYTGKKKIIEVVQSLRLVFTAGFDHGLVVHAEAINKVLIQVSLLGVL
ncbi:Regulator of K+ conductance, N-terminal [Sesbania bispinosa]|nr:Regulator of K+ conductance, N-terminal [Sesbania bispinosa]